MMKNIYFAGPVSINPEKATEEKKAFLEEHWEVLEENDINVYSPHLMYKWLSDIPENEGKGSRPEKYALRSCLNLIETADLDAIVMLTPPDEESSGMREERELAEDLGIPIYNLPYFSTSDDVLTVNGADGDDLEETLGRVEG